MHDTLTHEPSIGPPRYVPADLSPFRRLGRLARVVGMEIEIRGVRAAIGDLVRIGAAPGGLLAEVVAVDDDRAVVMPLGSAEGLAPNDPVEPLGRRFTIPVGDGLRGRVVDAFGRPIDRVGPLTDVRSTAFDSPVPHPLARQRIREPLTLGVRPIDALLTCGRGQRVGIFAGSGVGKSVLLSMLARNAAADVIVIGLIGERGREVREFLEEALGPAGLARAVVVVATSDEPAARRRMAAYVAAAVAEHFRDQGDDVLLLFDSVTRFAMAGREIGLAAGEPPTTKGYTPSVFAELPRLLERAGPGPDRGGGKVGSITGLFTVLVDGDDHNEPIADAVRGILDGHIVMERAIAERGRYPAINVLKSISRTMPGCHAPHENALVVQARRALSAYADMEELIRIGAYKAGASAEVDEAIRLRPALEAFLNQGRDEFTPIDETFAALERALQ